MSSVKKYSALSGIQTQENIREPYQINTHKLIGGVAKGPLQNDLEMTFCHAILLSVPCNFHKNIKSFRKIQTVKHFLAIGTGIVISCDSTKAVFFQMRSFFGGYSKMSFSLIHKLKPKGLRNTLPKIQSIRFQVPLGKHILRDPFQTRT